MGLKLILRNSLFLIPNLIKGDSETRFYVVKSWLNNNLTLLLNPLLKRFQQVILLSRISYLNRMDNTTKPECTDSIINKLDTHYINLKQRLDRNKEVIE